jgi:4-aminobutyrate aminotransferase/(S)-3-amino-2-methylpropionate transaminase
LNPVQVLHTATNSELLERRSASVPRGVSGAHPIFIDHASGAKVWDVEGRAYYDFVGGIGVLNAGHVNPTIVEAIVRQAALYTHLCFQVTSYEPYVAVAERLNALAPGNWQKKTLLVSSGAEATENAVKIARAYTKRQAVVAFQLGYHGRTMLALAMTGKAAPYKQNFGPFPSDVYHTPFPYEFAGWSTERALEALDDLFHAECEPDRVAAVIVEPVLGEGGFVPAPAAFLQALRRITAEHGIVLIADEVQSGFGRTGTMFAVEHAGIEPDLIVSAKSIAGGLPLAAVTGRAAIMDAPEPGGLGGTYAGNPLACAAALATFDLMDQAFLERSRAIGRRVRTALSDLKRSYPRHIRDVRGLGAMVGMELAAPPQGRTAAARLVAAARERGLLLLTAGAGNVIRILVPLVIDDRELDEALSILSESAHLTFDQ